MAPGWIQPVWVEWPRARIRRKLHTTGGLITEFVYQLEYDIDAGEHRRGIGWWETVARFDHDIDGPHDIRREGLHMDFHCNGGKIEVYRDFPTVDLAEAPRFCERFLQDNADELLTRFERRHISLTPRSR